MSSEHSEQVVLFLPRLFLTLIVISILLFMTSIHVDRDISTEQLEGDLLMNRVFYSVDCTAAETIRPRAGMIDLEKFTTERLATCLQGPAYVKATLIDNDREITNDPIEFEKREPFCRREDTYCAQKLVNVKIKDGEDDILKLEIIIPLEDRDAISSRPLGIVREELDDE